MSRVRLPKRVDWGYSATVKAVAETQKEIRIWMRQCLGAGKQIRIKRGPEQLSYFHTWYYRPDQWDNGFGGYINVNDKVSYYFINSLTQEAFTLRWNEYILELGKPKPKHAPSDETIR